MTPLRSNAGWVIVASLVVALMLTMMPLPEWARTLRPQWVPMVLIYWALALPHRIGVVWGWTFGLLLDVVHGAVLGQYALAMTVVIYIVSMLYQRLRLFPLSQQALIVGMLIILQLLVVLWIKGALDEAPDSWTYWLTALTTALLWPWCFLVLRDLRRKFRVN